MKRVLAALLFAALALLQAPVQAQARVYNQAELDALLAPIALYPDPLLSNILVAATYPDDVRDAAAWLRENPQLRGEEAVRAAEPIVWHPSVKALLPFPELLARMDESPQWTADLGAAFLNQEPHVMDAVQNLRLRAQASGALRSNEQYSVQQHGESIAVYLAQPNVVYVPYYDPLVVYGPWWWPAYRPVYWRPWYSRPVAFVSTSFFVTRVDWPRRHVVHHHYVHRAPAYRHYDRRPDYHRQVVAPRPQHVEGRGALSRSVQNAAQQVQRQQVAPRPHYTERRSALSSSVNNVVQRVQSAPQPIVQSARVDHHPRPIVDSVRIGQQPRPIVQSARLPERSEFREHRGGGNRQAQGHGQNRGHGNHGRR